MRHDSEELVNWRTLITEEMAHRGDSWGNVVSVALPDQPYPAYTGSDEFVVNTLEPDLRSILCGYPDLG